MEKLEKWNKWFRLAYLIILPIYVLVTSFYKGIRPIAEARTFQSIGFGLILAGLVLVLLLLFDFGISAWDKSTTWLANFLKKYPNARRVIIAPLFISTILLGINIGFFHWQWDEISRVIFVGYAVVALPAALLSILFDEKTRRLIKLSKQITPELIGNNPQAAIESAFTYFEDYLRKKLGFGAEIYGEELINLAFGNGGKLIYSEVDNENRGARNFISGTYATFRNPRKHRIVQDDEKTVLIIIDMVELLIKIVDESKDQEQASNKPK